MTRADYAVGTAFFIPTIVCLLGAAWLIAHRRLAHLTGAIRVASLTVLATAILVGVHIVPAALYLLSREAVLATAALVLVVSWRLPSARGMTCSGLPGARASKSESTLTRTAAWLGTGGFTAWLLGVVWQYRYHAPAGIDTLSFHLPTVAGWVQSGTIWRVDNFIPDLFFGNYPNNGDVVLLASLLSWHNDFLTHFAIYPFIPLGVVAAYCVARELGAPASAAVLLALTVMSVPVVLEPALNNALPDAVMFTTFAAGLAFLLRHRRTGATSDLVLAGLGLGLAFGTKWYGVSSVAVVAGIWLGARWRAGARLALVAREGALLGGLILAAGGVWLLRNWIFSGNPVYPVRIAPLGHTIFDAAPDRLRAAVGSSLADYLDDPTVWTDTLAHQFRIAAALPGAALLAGATAAAAAWRRKERFGGEESGLVLTGFVLLAVLVIAYVVTPYSALGPDGLPILAGANVRYVVPALIVSLGLAGWAAGRAGRRTLALIDVVLLLAILDGLRTSGVTTRARVSISLAVAGACVIALLLARRHARAIRRRIALIPRRAVSGVVAVTLIAMVIAGNHYQANFNRLRYTGPEVDPVLRWIDRYAPSGQRIGLAGVWTDRGLAPVYPAHGPRLGNTVVYNGPYVRELLRRWDRRRPFVAQLYRERLNLLIVGRGATFEQYLAGDRRLVLPVVKEERWARSADYREVLRSDRLILFAAPGSARGTSRTTKNAFGSPSTN